MRLRTILRISKLELSRNRSLARKDFLFTLLPTLIIFAIIAFTFVTKGFFVGDNFYRVHINDPRLADFFEQHPKFVLADDYDIQISLVRQTYYIDVVPNDRGRSALHTALSELKNYNHALYSQLQEEIAFPLLVSTEYNDRNVSIGVAITNPEELKEKLTGEIELPSQGGVRPDGSYQAAPQPADPSAPLQDTSAVATPDVLDAAPALETGGDTITTTAPARTTQPSAQPTAAELQNVPQVDPPTQNVQLRSSTSQVNGVPPGQLNALHSFSSMYLAMMLIFPLTMIGIIYSNSLMQDKTNKRIHLLLASPVSATEIVIGKTLPYVISALLSTALVFIRGGVEWHVLLLAPLISLVVTFLYLAIAFLVSMLARDAKELSFFMIFFLSIYSFVLLIPAFLSNVTNASLISPLTLVARLIDGGGQFAPIYLITLIPHFLLGLSLFVFGISMHNEENLLGYRTIRQKMVYGLAHLIDKPYKLAIYTAAIVPLAFIIEMLLLLPIASASTYFLVPVLFCAAFTEEALKCLGLYALASRQKLTSRNVMWWGFMGGLGFFLIEKGSFLITLPDLVKSYSFLVIGGLMVPLALHVGLAILYLSLIRIFGKNFGVVSYLIAALIHFIVNLNVVRFLL